MALRSHRQDKGVHHEVEGKLPFWLREVSDKPISIPSGAILTLVTWHIVLLREYLPHSKISEVLLEPRQEDKSYREFVFQHDTLLTPLKEYAGYVALPVLCVSDDKQYLLRFKHFMKGKGEAQKPDLEYGPRLVKPTVFGSQSGPVTLHKSAVIGRLLG